MTQEMPKNKNINFLQITKKNSKIPASTLRNIFVG